MSTSSVPVCYFPSTVIFLDENSDFLRNFTLQPSLPFTCHFFDQTADTLEALHLNQQSENLAQWCLNEPNQPPITQNNFATQTMCLDLTAIHWEVYNPQRFNECTVIVINTLASDLDKLTLCRNIQNHAIKKILLVDENEETLVNEAIKDSLIDLCLNKQDPNIKALLLDGIKHLQMNYFLEMSDTVSKMLVTKLSNCLYDPTFIDLFYQLQQQEQIVEYYLTEVSGSFLMLNAAGKPSCLVIKQQEDLLQHYNHGKNNNLPEELLEEIKLGKKIPTFLHSNNYYQWTDWANYIHKAQRLDGNNTYYYAYVKELWALDVHADRILSYNDYVKQRQS
ncbi:response regulator [soil metagenome]